MDIKTKFNVDDTVFFLTTTQDIFAMGDHPQNKPFVCEGVVTSFRIGYKYEKLGITYTVKVRNGRCADNSINWKWMEVEEGWLAPDLVQLGQDVSNRFKVNRLVRDGEKKKKRR